MDTIKKSLSEVSGRFIDLCLLLFAIFGSTSTLFTFFRDYPNFISPFTWLRVIISGAIFLFYFLRKRFSNQFKAVIVFSLMLILYVIGNISFGIFAPSKVFIVFGPSVILLIANFRQALIWAIGMSALYFLVGLGFIFGKIDYTIPPSVLWSSYGQWLGDLTILLGESIALIIMLDWFQKGIKNSISSIESQNTELQKKKSEINFLNNNLEHILRERTQNLELLNQKIFDENKLLKSQNEEIQLKKEELKKKEDQVGRLRQQLIVSERLSTLGMLTAGVSHEIKNPLNYLKGSAQLLRTRPQFSEDNVTNKKLLEIIENGVERIKKVVDSLNQFDRQSNQKEEETDILKIIENCLGVMQHQLTTDIALLFEKEFVSIVILANQDKLHQTVMNVLQNAKEAIRGKGTIQISTLVGRDSLILEIADSGEGIPDESLNLITDPFFTTKDPQNHTGLGLYQAQQTMNELRGSLRIISESDSGTVVRLIFPKPVRVIKNGTAQ